jgi:hypothetical protein
MPRKARPRAASDVASSNVRETQQRRTSSSRPKLEESPTDESDVFGATSSLILEADPTGKRGYLRVPAKAVSPKFDVRPIADDVGHGDVDIPEPPRNRGRQPAIEHDIPENSGDLDLPQPRSAWFVFGSDESLLTDDDLVESAGRVRWNVPSMPKLAISRSSTTSLPNRPFILSRESRPNRFKSCGIEADLSGGPTTIR